VLSTLFPRVNGTVTRVQDDRVEIDRGLDQGVRPGVVLSVVRAGAPFRHPLTGVVLGSSETVLGSLIVESATADHAVTHFTGATATTTAAVQAGDQARTSEGRLPVALVSTKDSEFLIARFREAIEETGRFHLVPLVPSTPVPMLIGDLPPSAELSVSATPLVTAARARGADYLLLFDARLRPAGTLGAVVIMETLEGHRVDSVQLPLHLNADELPAGPPDRPVDPLLQVMTAREGQAFRVASLPYAAEHFVIGDLDGDGEPDLVVSDGSRLRLYRLKAFTPELIEEEPLDRAGRRQLSIDLADINGTGHPQLFVTALVNDRLDSYVLQWQNGKLTRVAEHQPYYFRVLTPPKRPAVLVGQQRSLTTPFYAQVKTLSWTGHDYREEEALTLPPGVTIYDFTVADVARDGRGQLLYLDRDDRLVLVDPEGRLLGRSRDSFGGVESFIEYRPMVVTQGQDQPPLRARIPSRLLVDDLNGDGAVEVVVPHNVPLTKHLERVKMYRFGQIHRGSSPAWTA